MEDHVRVMHELHGFSNVAGNWLIVGRHWTRRRTFRESKGSSRVWNLETKIGVQASNLDQGDI